MTFPKRHFIYSLGGGQRPLDGTQSAVGAAIWLGVRGQKRWQLLNVRRSCCYHRPKQEK